MKQKRRTQRRAGRADESDGAAQDPAAAMPQQHDWTEANGANNIASNKPHVPQQGKCPEMEANQNAEAGAQGGRQPEEGEPAVSGLFNWLASPAASLGSPSLFASPNKIPLFQRSPRTHGPPGSPTNQFSVNSFANIFQSPLRTPMNDALHAALGGRFDTPCSAHFADNLFSPSPRRSSRLAASARAAGSDALYADMAAWDMGSGGAQQARGSGAGNAALDALAEAQHEDAADLVQKLLRSPVPMDAIERPNTRSRAGGPSRLGAGTSNSRRRCLDFSKSDSPASLPLTRSRDPAAGPAAPGSGNATEPFLRSAAEAAAVGDAPVGQFITIPVPGGAAVPVGNDGLPAALLPLQWGAALQLQQGQQEGQQVQALGAMLMVPQQEALDAMQLFMPAGAGGGAAEQAVGSMQALLADSPSEGRARSRGRQLRKLMEADEQLQEQEEEQRQQQQEVKAEGDEQDQEAPGSGSSDVRRTTRRTRGKAAAAANAAKLAPKGVQASVVQQAVAHAAGRRQRAAAAQAAAASADAGTMSAEQQPQRSSPAEQSALLSTAAHALLPATMEFRMQLLSGDSQASGLAPLTPDDLRREQAVMRTCHCKKSRCLKLYCECFANGMYCTNCSCADCANTQGNAEEVMSKRQTIKQRDPAAFDAKLRRDNSSRKGCNCRKSHCLKKYCECFQLGARCGDMCKCIDCKNTDAGAAQAEAEAAQQARMQHPPVSWQVGQSVGTPPTTRTMSRTMSEAMGTPQTHGTAVGPMVMRVASMGTPATPASNGPLLLLSLPPAPSAAAALASRQHPQLPVHSPMRHMHPADPPGGTPSSSRRSSHLAVAQLGAAASAVQQQLAAAAPKVQQLAQGMESGMHGGASPSRTSSMDATASGDPSGITSAPVALRTRHRLSAVSSHGAIKAEPGTEGHVGAGRTASQAHTPRGGRLQSVQEEEVSHPADVEDRRSRSLSLSRASTPTSSQLMPPPPRQQVPHHTAHTQASAATAAAASAAGERVIRLGVDGPLLKLPAAALTAAPAVRLLRPGDAPVMEQGAGWQQQQGQQQQQRDQGDANSQVGVLIYLQDDTGKVSAYYVPTAPGQDGQLAVGACLPQGVALMQPADPALAALQGCAPGPMQGVPHQQQRSQQQQQQQQEVDLEADETLQQEEEEEEQQQRQQQQQVTSPTKRLTRHAAAAAAAAAASARSPVRSTPTKRKAAGSLDDQDAPRQNADVLHASPVKYARSPGGPVRTQLFKSSAAAPVSPTGMMLRNRVLSHEPTSPRPHGALSPSKLLASPSSGRGSMFRFSPGSTLLSPTSKGRR